jgi:putative addiction module killer protein
MKIKEYLRRDGTSPFASWLKSLDGSLKYRVQARIMKLKSDEHFGFTKRLGVNLYELKFRTLGGIRIYYGIDGKNLVILLCGGDKNKQSKDIEKAQIYWADYHNRSDEEEV